MSRVRTERLRASVEINKGEGDLALLQRDGEYSVMKIEWKWSINEYVNKQIHIRVTPVAHKWQ